MAAENKTERTMRNELVGEVVSNKMTKTISVQVYSKVRHGRYGKFVKRSNVFKAHDEKGVAKVGDRVRIFETRPLSRTKRWMLCEVIESRNTVQGIDV
jgi:small subunit ribosomal protein S17